MIHIRQFSPVSIRLNNVISLFGHNAEICEQNYGLFVPFLFVGLVALCIDLASV